MLYSEAYDKIIQAYFKDEIRPWDASFCFCGNLCDKSNEWYMKALPGSIEMISGYKGHEFHLMERALLDTMYKMRVFAASDTGTKEYEGALFAGMCAALEVLKRIHIKRGEIIDETPAFTKRELQPA